MAKQDMAAQSGNGGFLDSYFSISARGSSVRQEFPVDAESVAMFEREGMNASVTNTWAMEIEPGARFLYELARPGGRLFQVEFDLTRPVAAPPPPWGADAAATEKGA